MQLKTCASCSKDKPLEDFISKNNTRSCCLECRRGGRAKRYRDNHKHKLKNEARTYRLKNPFHTLCSGHKSRSFRLGIPFNLTPEYLEEIYPENGLCPVLSTPLILGGTLNDNRQQLASLDRIIPHLGYTKGNVRWISYRANAIRNNATVEELKAVLAYVIANQPAQE